MPLIPSRALIQTHTLALLTTSALLLTNPSLLTSAVPIWLLGEAMHIRDTPAFSLPSEPLAFAALVLAVAGLTEAVLAGGLGGLGVGSGDGSSTRMKRKERSGSGGVKGSSSSSSSSEGLSIQAFAEKAAILHHMQRQWMTASTIKTLALGLLVIYLYLTSKQRGAGLYQAQILGNVVPVERLADVGTGLQMLNNRVTFVVVLSEMFFSGYLWTVLKEEMRELAVGITVRRREEEEKEGEGEGRAVFS